MRQGLLKFLPLFHYGDIWVDQHTVVYQAFSLLYSYELPSLPLESQTPTLTSLVQDDIYTSLSLSLGSHVKFPVHTVNENKILG